VHEDWGVGGQFEGALNDFADRRLSVGDEKLHCGAALRDAFSQSSKLRMIGVKRRDR